MTHCKKNSHAITPSSIQWKMPLSFSAVHIFSLLLSPVICFTVTQLVEVRSLSSRLASTTLPDVSQPLPAHKFSGIVEQALRDKFGEENIIRVVQSWRLLEQGYEHKEYLGPPGAEDSSNYLQYAHSYIPGLRVQPFWDVEQFPWVKKLKQKYRFIRQEFDQVNANPTRLEQDGNNVWAGALTQDASSYGKGWKTLVLMDRGRWDPDNCKLFPIVAKAIHDAGVPAAEVFFASMQPHSDIQLHSDFTNFVLTSHLAIDIPHSGENKCRLTIGDETRQWINGECMVFDTSIMHDAINESDKTRYILMMRVWHPDLTAVERQALEYLWDCLANTDLFSDDPRVRANAEEQMKALRVFPLHKGQGTKQGFGGGGAISVSSKKKRKK